ncbi:hypothetical protein [Methylobacter sp.]|uniref:VgrG-related protein n=1 Tax=Methylobacter sp. TaxID=2051955 RepID=UPI002FDDFFAF
MLSSSTNSRESGNSRASSGGSNARISSMVATPTGARSGNQGPALRLLSSVSSSEVATPGGRIRDASGRFIANRNAGADSSGAPGDDPEDKNKNKNKEKEQSRLLNGFANRIATAITATTAGAEEADPTIKAFKEVAEPLARGYQIFSGGIGGGKKKGDGKKDDGEKKERWYRRILNSLDKFRREESAFNRVENRILRNIEGNSGAGSGNGGGGSGGGMMLLISGMLARLGPLLLTGITGVLGFIFSPIGLAIGAAAAVAWGLFTEEGQKFFGEVGAKVIDGWNTVVTAFAPVSESISKGWETVKGGFDSLISGMVSSWESFTGFLKDKFGIDIPAIFKPVVDVSKKAVEAATNTVSKGADVAKKTAEAGIEAVKKSSPKTAEAVGNLWEKAKEGAKNISDRATNNDLGLGYISSRYEGNIGSAHKDNIGSAYGRYQFNTEGGLPQFLKDNPQYAAQLAEGGAPGSAGFNKKWEQIAKDDPSGFLAAQEASGRKQYYDPAIKKAGSLGFNTEDRGIQEAMFSGAVQHGGWNSKVLPRIAQNYDLKSMSAPDQLKAIYAERRKYASENLKGADLKNVLSRYDSEENNTVDLSVASKGEAPSSVPESPAPESSTPTATASISDDPTQSGRYKYEPLEGGNAQVTDNQSGTMELASDEQANAYRKQQGKQYLDAFAAANNPDPYRSLNSFVSGPGKAAQVQVASAPPVKPPVFAPPPPIAEAPPIIEPLASNSSRSMTVSMPAQDVGQDVKDRGIAHIVTGGYSSRG